jgi:hypothetical protein
MAVTEHLKEGSAMSKPDKKHRSHLPMLRTPPRSQFIAFDAKDPNSSFPPIEDVRPPKAHREPT